MKTYIVLDLTSLTELVGEVLGIRSYKANEALRCYRQVHNNVDVHNQWSSYGHWDFRTRRKQMRVSRTIKIRQQCVTIYFVFEIGFSLFDSFVVVNSFIVWRNYILKNRPEKERTEEIWDPGGALAIGNSVG